MTTSLRVGLETLSIASVVLAGWLASVVLNVLPTRDPGHVQLWSLVTVGVVCFAAASFLAIRPVRRAPPFPAGLAAALGVLAVAAVGFGLFVLGSEMSDALAGDPEGYLFVVGVIVTAHGALALGWLAAVRMGLRR
ncbi:MAG TPA: hypothetical protein VHM48_03170 [Candidatus Limnocylindrales bacterium]|nr:hypothetical protein [Candidatus Limnocylindrales bacterium]